MFEYTVDARDRQPAARAGRFTTPHGVVETPVFMPVGTAGSVKGLTPEMVRATGTSMILANTYHLALRPGAEIVAELGGLHAFTGWDGPILTDSGGYQVFSLGERAAGGTKGLREQEGEESGSGSRPLDRSTASLVRIDEDGVSFRSHLDGAPLRLDPAEAMRIQNLLGADVIMVLDQCIRYPASRDDVIAGTLRSIRWAARCKAAHARTDQALFGIVQGGVHHDLRRECAEALIEIGFPGYAIGGLAIGETPSQMDEILAGVVPHLPEDRPRYLMGVGRPIDILRAVARGIDMFDCVMPTRNGRNSCAFTSQGIVRLRNEEHKRSRRPLDPACDCYACRNFSRGYLRHLFLAGEMLGPILASLHNIAYYQSWMARIRQSIRGGTLAEWLADENAT